MFNYNRYEIKNNKNENKRKTGFFILFFRVFYIAAYYKKKCTQTSITSITKY